MDENKDDYNYVGQLPLSESEGSWLSCKLDQENQGPLYF